MIRDTARRLARYRWMERRLFELTGRWAPDAGDAEVTRVLAAESLHHAWRASMWDGLVPVLHDLDPAALAPDPDDVSLLDAVAAPPQALERLTGLVRVVLPSMFRQYEGHLASATDVADAPVARVLRLVLLDVQEDWRAARGVLASSLRSEDELARAAAHQSYLEQLVAPEND